MPYGELSDPISGYRRETDVVQSTSVSQAAGRYEEGKNEAFVEGGDGEDIRDRLCADCPAVAYCGAAVARLVLAYPDRMVPSKDRQTLRSRGICSSEDGFEVCPGDLVRSAVSAVHHDVFVVAGDDPLRGSTQGHQAVETVRLAVDNTVRSLRNGIRL
jgi:hypothetical protein